jgi:hypothetical protein
MADGYEEELADLEEYIEGENPTTTSLWQWITRTLEERRRRA